MKVEEFWFVPIVVCLLVAGAMAYKGIDEWGWFLFASLLLTPRRGKDNEL
jgi:hypothetical protein